MAEPWRRAFAGKKGKRIAEVLRAARRPLSAYDLVEQLRDEGVNAPTTVYRALNRLIAAGYVHRLESLNAFVSCARECRHGTAVFAICDACGAVTEFADDLVSGRLVMWADVAKFTLERTTIELRGRCNACRPGTIAESV